MDQPRGRIMRLLAVAVAVLVLTAAYVATLSRFRVSEQPGEQYFGAAEAVEPAGAVYFEPVGVDAFNDALQLRAYLTPNVAAANNAHAAADRDLTLLVSHDKTVEELKLAAGDHIATATFELDLNEGQARCADVSLIVSMCCTEKRGGEKRRFHPRLHRQNGARRGAKKKVLASCIRRA
jgi:hypothetical protein